jgi:hypothetical protein
MLRLHDQSVNAAIDFIVEPITLAKQKATERGLTAKFQVLDALTLKELPEVFDTVIDSGSFHIFSDDDWRRDVEGLAQSSRRAGVYLLCVSDDAPCVGKRNYETPSPKAG